MKKLIAVLLALLPSVSSSQVVCSATTDSATTPSATTLSATPATCASDSDEPFDNHETLTDGLVAYWSLDEESGTRADSASTNHLTDNNTVGFAAGKSSNAAFMVATNVESLSSTSAVFDFSENQSFTISGWVRTEAGSTLNGIFGKWTGADRAYACLTAAATKPVWRVQKFDNSTHDEITATNGPVINDNAFHFIVVWHDADADIIGISVDNSTANTVAHTGGVAASADPFFLGGALGAGVTWDGRMDEVGVWTRVLTAQERTDLYNGGAGLFY